MKFYLCLLAGLSLVACQRPKPAAQEVRPQSTSAQEMPAISLTKSDSNPAPDHPPEIDYYTCPMHTWVRLHNPKDKCPICGMDTVPVYKRSASASAPAASPATSEPASTHPFDVAPERLQAIGVTSDLVRKQTVEQTFQAPALAVVNEAGLHDINIKGAGGYVTKLHANYVGKFVKKGEPLMTVLSEGWIEAQMDYIKAYRALRRTPATMMNYNSFALDNQAEQLRKRIRVWDLSETQIRKLEKFALSTSEFDLRTGKGLSGEFQLLSPIDGHVHKKDVVEGMKFEAGQSLMQLVDLSTIWIQASFPENQAPYITVGQTVDLAFPALRGKTFQATVDFINPHLMEDSRRIDVRMTLDNPGHVLRPGMYGNATIHAPRGEILAVPSSAIIPTGEQQIVFLDHGQGHLEPRFIQTGDRFGENTEVISGLKEGDRVITSANFLIDAESRIQGALKTWGSSQ